MSKKEEKKICPTCNTLLPCIKWITGALTSVKKEPKK